MGITLKPYNGPKQRLTRPAYEKFMRERLDKIKEMYGHSWPVFACTDTCCMIIDDLRATFKGRFRVKNGYFRHPKLKRCRHYQTEQAGHSWIIHESGWIIDPTVGQFSPAVVRRPAYRLFTKRDKEYKLYDFKADRGIGRGFYYSVTQNSNDSCYLW